MGGLAVRRWHQQKMQNVPTVVCVRLKSRKCDSVVCGSRPGTRLYVANQQSLEIAGSRSTSVIMPRRRGSRGRRDGARWRDAIEQRSARRGAGRLLPWYYGLRTAHWTISHLSRPRRDATVTRTRVTCRDGQLYTPTRCALYILYPIYLLSLCDLVYLYLSCAPVPSQCASPSVATRDCVAHACVTSMDRRRRRPFGARRYSVFAVLATSLATRALGARPRVPAAGHTPPHLA